MPTPISRLPQRGDNNYLQIHSLRQRSWIRQGVGSYEYEMRGIRADYRDQQRSLAPLEKRAHDPIRRGSTWNQVPKPR